MGGIQSFWMAQIALLATMRMVTAATNVTVQPSTSCVDACEWWQVDTPNTAQLFRAELRCPTARPNCTMRYYWINLNASAHLLQSSTATGELNIYENGPATIVTANVTSNGPGEHHTRLTAWEVGHHPNATNATSSLFIVHVDPHPTLAVQSLQLSWPRRSAPLAARLVWRPVQAVESGLRIRAQWRFKAGTCTVDNTTLLPSASDVNLTRAADGLYAAEHLINATVSSLRPGNCTVEVNIAISSDQRQHTTNLTGEAVITLVNRAPNVTLSRLEPTTCGVLHDDNVTSRAVRLRADSTDSDGNVTSRQWQRFNATIQQWGVISAQLGSGAVDMLDDHLPSTAEHMPPGRLYWYRFCAGDDAGSSACRNVSVAVMPAVEATPVARCGRPQWLLMPQSSARIEGVLRCPVSQPAGCTLHYAWRAHNASTALERSSGTVVLAANASETSVHTTVRNLTGAGAYVLELSAWVIECGQAVHSAPSTTRAIVHARPSLVLRDISAAYPSQSAMFSARVKWRPVDGIENGTAVNVSWFAADVVSCPLLAFIPQKSHQLLERPMPSDGDHEITFNTSTTSLPRGSYCTVRVAVSLYSPSWRITLAATAGIRVGGLFLCPIASSSGGSGGGGGAGARCLPSFLSQSRQQAFVRSQTVFTGFSADTFDSGARSSFTATIADHLNTSSSSVSIDGVADTVSLRRRLAAQVAVDFRIASSAPDSTKAALDALGSGSAVQQVLTAMKAALVSRNVSSPMGFRMDFPTPATIDLTGQVTVVGTTYDAKVTQCFERFQLAVEQKPTQQAAEHIYDGGAVQLGSTFVKFNIVNKSQSAVPRDATFRCHMRIGRAVDTRTGAVALALLSGSVSAEREGIGTIAFGAPRPVLVHAMPGTVLTLVTRCMLHGDQLPDHVSKPVTVQPLLNVSLQTASWPSAPVAPWHGLPSLTAKLTSTVRLPDDFTNSTVCSLRLVNNNRTSDLQLGGQTLARALNNTVRFDAVSVQAVSNVPLFGRRLDLELECKYGNVVGHQSIVAARKSLNVANLTVRVANINSSSLAINGAVAAHPIEPVVLEVLEDGGGSTPTARRTDDQYTVCVVNCTRGCIGTLVRTASSGLVTFDDLGFKTAKLDTSDERTLEFRCRAFGSELQVQRIKVTVARCPEGKRPNNQRTACQRTCECDRSQYQPISAIVGQCEPCPANAKTVHDAGCDSRCICAAGFFDSTDGVGLEPICTGCGHKSVAAHTDCLRDGLTFSSLESYRGYWQDKSFFDQTASNEGLRYSSLAFERCQERQECRDLKNEHGAAKCRCKAASNHSLVNGTGCLDGHNGPLCMTCLEGYQMNKERICEKCTWETKDQANAFALLVFVCIVLVPGIWMAVRKFKKRYEDKREELRKALLWLDRYHGT